MNANQQNGKPPGARENGSERQGFEAGQDHELEAVLKDFRASVHAWSEATYQSRVEAAGRSRALVLSPAPHRTLLRRSVAWAMSLVLTAGVAMAGVYEYHQKELARQVAVRRQLEQRRLEAQQRAREADELLARVDSDVSREEPSAMEPLASLMADDETQ